MLDGQHPVVGEEADQVAGRELADLARRAGPDGAGEGEHEVLMKIP
jgi:hypothetical protein